MPAPPAVLELVERFKLQQDDYLRSDKNETETRRELIDPLFGRGGLGWDIDNADGHAEAYKDVVHEDKLKIGSDHTAPDYCFRVGGTRKFFLEAKKPFVKIHTDGVAAYQLRRYAWSAKLPLSILTDFEELAVYDTRIKPSEKDKASVARVMYLHYTEYNDRWDDLAGIFSRDAVYKGSFDRYAESTKKKRGTSEVDAAFLEEIERWRLEIARNLALRNDDLSQRDLNFAVQRIIDRLVFLRIAEDRGIEEYGKLRTLLNGENVYPRLAELFRRADERYNSGLFHFEPEPDRQEPPDDLTLGLALDDKVLKGIIKHLYYPDSPYEFSVLPADILGQVYEQFLGKVITLTAGHRASVEDKPEVKKAGGVYYTPTYIVDYIVQQTVGKLLSGVGFQPAGEVNSLPARAGKMPAPLQTSGVGFQPASEEEKESPQGRQDAYPTGMTVKQAAKLRVLDPACGSGSFLIGAYQHLLDWHLQQYLKAPEKHRKEVYQGARGAWRLTTAERKRILLANIYGVDIDTQAVEVTKLSLLLKVLEGDSAVVLRQQQNLFHVLPDLSGNIKCGNSLIGPDFYEGKQLSMFDEEERYRINVFDWQVEFPKVMKAGGFDAVIGNPPYVNVRILGQTQGEGVKRYLESQFETAERAYDLYVLFIEKSFDLLRDGGQFGMIVPNKLGTLEYSRACRDILLTKTSIQTIVDLSHCRVFWNASVYPYVVTWQKTVPPKAHRLKIVIAETPADLHRKDAVSELLQRSLSSEGGFAIHGELDVESRVPTEPLSQRSKLDSGTTGFSAQQMAEALLDGSNGDPSFEFIVSGNIDRYLIQLGNVRFMGRKFARPHLPIASDVMTERKRALFRSQKLVVAGMTKRLEVAIDQTGLALGVQVFSISNSKDDLFYVLALLNSSLMSFLFRMRFQAKHLAGGFLAINKGQLERLPIRVCATEDMSAVKLRDRIINLSLQLNQSQDRLSKLKTPHQRTSVAREITALDRQIDQLVYELYGLSDEEIALVEAATAPREEA